MSLVVFAHNWRTGARAVHDLHGLGFRTVLNAARMRLKERLDAAATRAAESRRPPVLQRLGLTAENNDVVATLVKQEERAAARATSDSGPRDVIFAPVDFSEGSRRALRTALALQAAMGSEVHLFHLAEVGADDRFIASIGGSSTTPAHLVKDSKERLHRFVNNVCPGRSTEVSVHAYEGVDVVVGIERVAMEIRATLIVLGHGSTDAVFRTHVERVARQVDGAVLLL